MPKLDSNKNSNKDEIDLVSVPLMAVQPTLITSVSRKVNVGNFETVDVHAAISLPINVKPNTSFEELSQIVNEAASQGFAIVSKEVSERYNFIKNMTVAKDANV